MVRSSAIVALEFMAAAVNARATVKCPAGFTGVIRHTTRENWLAGESIQLILSQSGWAC